MNSRILVRCVLAAAISALSMSSAKAQTIVDKPFIKVTPVYANGVTKDMYGNTIDFIDKQHQYIGVTVGCERTVYKFSGNCYITDGNGNYLTPELMYEEAKHQKDTEMMSTFNEDSILTTFKSVKVQQEESQGTFFSTVDPTVKEEWVVTQVGGYYTIKSSYKNAYLAVKGSDPRMYLTYDSTDVYTQWQINSNGQIYQDRNFGWTDQSGWHDAHTYFALHYKSNNSFETERHDNILLESVVKSQIIPIRAAVFSSYVAGTLDTDSIIKAIKDRLAISSNKYAYTKGSAENLCKGLLYVDMSGLEEVKNTNSEAWKTFQEEVAANCLFFVPETYNSGSLEKNVVAKSGDGFEAKTDFVLTDLDASYTSGYTNPFFSPYTFDVNGLHKAKYSRPIARSSISTTSTIILPFSVDLFTGHSSKFVRFYSINNQENNGLISLFASLLSTGPTKANMPYHVQMPENVSSLEVEEYYTTVEKTQVKEYVNNMGDWLAYGNFFGKMQQKSIDGGAQYYYYTKGAYVNSSFRTSAFYADPYRVYFSPVDGRTSAAKSLSIVYEDEEESTGIESATTEETANSEEIYTLSGVKVNGKPQHGIYVVNGKKKMF